MPILAAAKETHETLLKKFGTGWNVVMGKSYGLEGKAVEGTTLQMFYQGENLYSELFLINIK